MVKPFKLAWPIGRSDAMDKEDIENTKQALDALGLYEPPQLFTERFSTEPMIRGLKTFQRQEGLVPDGVMNPGGPTHDALNRALTAGFQDESEDSGRSSPRTSLHGPSSRFQSRPSNLSNSPIQQTPKEAPNKRGDRQYERQVAAGPVIPFGVWLMQALGTATVALAMAIYNSWDKKRQKAARDLYEVGAVRVPPGGGEECERRYKLELGRCRRWPRGWPRDGCVGRAKNRRNLCNRHGGTPYKKEPPEWSEADMM